MSRRLASRLQPVLAMAVAVGTLTGCGGSDREAPVPPPITASKPAEPPGPAPAPAALATPPTESAPAAEGAPPPAATTPAPASTHDTSLPGAIPPSPAPDPNAKPTVEPVDPVQWLRDSQARKAEYKRSLEQAQANVVNADAKVAEWEKNVLAFANPFLARPQLSPDDTSAIAGMDGAERMRWAKGRLAEARAARDASQQALDALKANPPLN